MSLEHRERHDSCVQPDEAVNAIQSMLGSEISLTLTDDRDVPDHPGGEWSGALSRAEVGKRGPDVSFLELQVGERWVGIRAAGWEQADWRTTDEGRELRITLETNLVMTIRPL
jgi:hypothetical protein